MAREAGNHWFCRLHRSNQTNHRLQSWGSRLGFPLQLNRSAMRFSGCGDCCTRKFGCEELARPITKTAIAALRNLKKVSPAAPFDAAPTTAWYALWHALRAEAGLPSWVTPHSIRKSVASHLPSLDDACEMLGHSSSATTRANYRDPRVAGGPQLVDKLFDPLDQPKRRWLGWFAG